MHLLVRSFLWYCCNIKHTSSYILIISINKCLIYVPKILDSLVLLYKNLVMDIQKIFLHRKKKTFNNFFLCKILFPFRSVACSMFLYKVLETFDKKPPLHRQLSLLLAFSIKLIPMILLLIFYKNVITQTPQLYIRFCFL